MRPRVVKERNEEGETVRMYNAAEGENESERVRTVEWRTKLKRQKVKRKRELQKGGSEKGGEGEGLLPEELAAYVPNKQLSTYGETTHTVKYRYTNAK